MWGPEQRQGLQGRRSEIQHSTSPQANERARAGIGGIKHYSRLSQKQLCCGLGGQVGGRRHDVFKTVQAPEWSRNKAAPAPCWPSLAKGHSINDRKIGSGLLLPPPQMKTHQPDPAEVLITC